MTTLIVGDLPCVATGILQRTKALRPLLAALPNSQVDTAPSPIQKLLAHMTHWCCCTNCAVSQHTNNPIASSPHSLDRPGRAS